MSWSYLEAPVMFQAGSEIRDFPDQKVIVRSDTHAPLSVYPGGIKLSSLWRSSSSNAIWWRSGIRTRDRWRPQGRAKALGVG